MLIIPLPKSQSRGDQILNAQAFSKKGYAVVLEEEQLTKETFIEQIDYLESHGTVIQANMREATKTDTIAYLVEQIDRMHKG